MIIREMTAEDIPAAIKIDKAAFSKAWDENTFADELKKDYAHYFICLDGDEAVGYAGCWCLYETAELIRIAAVKKHCGIGSALMKGLLSDSAERGCEKIMLEVRDSNAPARGMYEKFGFGQISVRRGYYDGEDAIIMEKSLV